MTSARDVRGSRLCIFCGSSMGTKTEYADAARALGRLMAARGIGVVYGGASVGLMGAVADAALEAGGEVIGVIPRVLWEREVGHTGLTDLHVVDSMHERKALMAELSDGFIALPGGIGTFEELFEVWTWAYLGLHRKPVALLDTAGFYAPLTTFIESAAQAGFIKPAQRDGLLVDSDPAALLDRIARHRMPAVEQVIDRTTA